MDLELKVSISSLETVGATVVYLTMRSVALPCIDAFEDLCGQDSL